MKYLHFATNFMHSSALLERRTTLDMFLDKAKSGLFGLGYIMVKDVPIETRSFLVLMFIDFLQLAAFPLNSSPALPWGNTPVAGLSSVLNYITTDTVDVTHSLTAFKVVLALAAIWVGLFLFMAMHVAKNFLEDAPQQAMELRVLRSIALLSTTTLFLPLTSVLFRGLACPNEYWLGSSWKCESPARVTLTLVLTLMLVGFSFLSLFVAAVFIDRNPASASWSARSHGRVDVILLCNKLLLSFFFNVLNEVLVGHWTLTAIMIAGGCLWYYLMVTRMPLTHEWVNSLQAGFALGYTWLCVCLALGQGIGGQVWMLVYVTTPFVIAVGYFVASTHARKVVTQPLEECRTVDEANAWARSRMQVFRKLIQGESDGALRAQSAKSISDSSTSSQPRRPTNIASSIAAAAGTVVRRIASFQSEATTNPNRRNGATAPHHNQRFDDAGTVASRSGRQAQAPRAPGSVVSVATNHPSNRYRQPPLPVEDPIEEMRVAVVQEARQGYQYLTSAFSDKELAYMLAASFYEHHSKWNFQEATALARSIARSPALDTRFQVYRRSRQMRESDGTGLSPIDRILFDQKMKEVSQMRMTAFRTIQDVWATLASQTPDLLALSRCAKDLDLSLERIEQTYLDLLRINSDSVRVLRGYASFLSDIRNDAARAQEFLNKADRVDELATRSTTRTLKHVDFGATGEGLKSFDENAAVVTVSAFESNLGEMLKVTPAATRMFGFSSKSYMIGQNVSILMPSPIREVHDSLLRHFRGQSSSMVMNKTRLMVGMTRSGTIFPVWLAVMEAPPDEVTCEPRFQAYFGEVVTTEEMVIFGGEEEDFCMYGCTAGIERLFGLTGDVVQSERPSMLHWFPTLSKTYDPQEVRLEENQAEWLKRGVAKGEVTGQLAQLVGGGGSGDRAGKATFRLSKAEGLRHRSTTISTVAQRLLNLTTQGIIPVAETSRDSDSVGGGDASSVESDDADLLKIKTSEQALLFGSVKAFESHHTIPTFYVLTCRPIPREADAAAAVAAPSSPIRISNRERTESQDTGGGEFFPPEKRREGMALSPPTVHSLSGIGEVLTEEDDEEEKEKEKEKEVQNPNWEQKTSNAAGDLETFPTMHNSSNTRLTGNPSNPDFSQLQEPTKAITEVEKPTGILVQGSEHGSSAHLVRFSTHLSEVSSTPGKKAPEQIEIPHQPCSTSSLFDKSIRGRRDSAGGSVNARSQVSGTTAKTGIATQLRRSLQSIRALVEPEVGRIRVILLLLVAAVLVMAVVVNIWINSTWERVAQGANSIRLAGERSTMLTRGVSAAFLLAASNEGIPETSTGLSKTHLIEMLQDSSATMVHSIDKIYELGVNGGATAHWYETKRTFVIIDPITREERSETILGLAARMSSILGRLSLRGENVTIESNDMNRLLTSSLTLRDEFMASLRVRHEDTLDVFANAQIELAVGGLSFLILSVAFTSFFLLKSIRSLERRTRRTLLSFLFLPHRLSKALQQRAALMLQEVVSETAEEGGGGDDEDQVVEEDREQLALIASEKCAEDIDRVMEALRVQAASRFATHPDEEMDGDNGDDLPVMTMDDAGATMNHRREEAKVFEGKIRRFTDSSELIGSRVWILLSPVLAVFLLLVTIFVWQSLGATNVTDSANRVVALERSSRALTAMSGDFSGSTFHPNESFRINHRQELRAAQQELVRMLDMSLLGGEIRAVEQTAHIPPVNNPRDPVYQVLAIDTCIAIKDRLGDKKYDECRSFEEQVLTHGIVAAVKEISSSALLGVQMQEQGLHLLSSNYTYPPDLTPEFANQFSKVQQAIHPFLQVALDFASAKEDSYINQWAQSVQGGNVIVTWVMSVLISLFSLTYIWREAGDVALPLRSAQGLLTIMPTDAISVIPALHREIRSFATSSTLNNANRGTTCCASSKVSPQ